MDEATRQFIGMWLADHRARPIPAAALGCPCGCTTKRPYLIDPDCMLQAWPVREDPVCAGCGTILDPDGSCYGCAQPIPAPAQVFEGRCHGCGKPGHYRSQCLDRKGNR